MPLKSRDELPPTLAGLQWIFKTPEVNEEIFSLLEQKISTGLNTKTGRPGMDYWQILVLGVVRLCFFFVKFPSSDSGVPDVPPAMTRSLSCISTL